MAARPQLLMRFDVELLIREIEAYKIRTGINDTAMCAMVGVAPSFFINMRVQKKVPSTVIFLTVCKLLGTNPYAYLVERTSAPTTLHNIWSNHGQTSDEG